jgi:hypothetical protein
LNEIKSNVPNPNIIDCLNSHAIGDSNKLLSGEYDTDYFSFLSARYQAIEPILNELKNASHKLNDGIDEDIWK